MDDDVAAQLKVEGRLSGRPFREIVNETLRAVWRSAHHGPPRLHRDRAAARFPLRADAYRELGHDEEFARKNIFYLGHPEHAEFHRVMRSLAAYEKLSLGNLPEFVRPESEARFHMPHWRDTIRDKRDPPPKS